MTLDLCIRCIGYLCQEHHDLEVIGDEMDNFFVSGAYRFHNFASTYWWRLFKQYLVLSKSTTIPDCLIDQLLQLHGTRSADVYQQGDSNVDMDLNVNAAILALELAQPDLAEMLRNVSRFLSVCSKADYHLQSCEYKHLLDNLPC